MSRSSLRNALLMERVQLAKVQDAVGQGEVGLGSWKTSVGGSIPFPAPWGACVLSFLWPGPRRRVLSASLARC